MSRNMYSMKTKGFYPADPESQKPYIEAGSLPDDLVEVSDEDYISFFNPPDGFYLVFDDKGPRLEKLPDPIPGAANLQQAQVEYDNASARIRLLQDRVDDEDYDDTYTEEAVKQEKSTWTAYRKSLRAYLTANDGTKDLPTAPQ